MKIINTVPSSGGSYRIQDDPSRTSPPGGYARVPEELDLAEFYAAKGFVSPSFEDDVMTGYTVNQELLDAWNTAHPDPDVLLEAREQKLTELSAACNAAIVAGCDVELADGVTGHISLTSEDQINLTNAAASVSAGAETERKLGQRRFVRRRQGLGGHAFDGIGIKRALT